MNKGKVKSILMNSGLTALAIMIFSIFANSQTIDSTGALRLACETNPNNAVTIDYPAKISNGAGVDLPEQVKAPCTIVLTGSGSFETDQVGMSFNGAFSIQAAGQTQVKFVKSFFSADSMSLMTTGSGSLIGVSESLLKTTAGDLNLMTGFDGVAEITLPLSGALNSLEASGAVNLSGGGKFNGVLTESQISAGTGINVSLGGAEGIFKSDKSNLVTANGAVTIGSQGFKSLVELGFGQIRAANGVNITLPGSEGNLVLADMIVNSGTGSIAFDVARIGNVGKILVSGSNFVSGSNVTILASLNGRTGLASVENTSVLAVNDIIVRTGRVGETIVKTSNMRSQTLIQFRTGIGGKCLAEQNVLVAPTVIACR